MRRWGLMAVMVWGWNMAAGGATLTVTNTADSGPGSFREALSVAYTSVPPTFIGFAISGSGPFVISPSSPLPYIADNVIVDGSTQPGFQLQAPSVVLDGSMAGNDIYGIYMDGANSVLRGLCIQNFHGSGVLMYRQSNRVEGCVILSNSLEGIRIEGSQTVGGLVQSNRNIISGNGFYGVRGLNASNSLIAGNGVGIHPTNSLQALPNGSAGIFLLNCTSNRLLGAAGLPQTVSGNTFVGIHVQGGGYNTLQGQHVGCDPGGTMSVSNGMTGIYVENSAYNLIGGTNAVQRNVVSGNAIDGVVLQGEGAHHNVVLGNYIGVASAGQPALPNRVTGLVLEQGAHDNQVGGSQTGAGNVLSGNLAEGLAVSGVSNIIQGNLIGLNAAANAIVSNRSSGIYITGSWNLIGGGQAGQRNLIGGNGFCGIFVSGGPSNQVQGNLIGLDASGVVRPNQHGVYLNYSSNNVIGGAAANVRNIISGNSQHGLYILSLARDERIQGNYIGTTAAGNAVASNRSSGIRIDGATNIWIGGEVAGAGNLISGNNNGIEILNGARGVTVAGNVIGLAADGLSRLNAMVAGISVNGSSGCRIGGTNVVERNVIAGCFDGVLIINSAGTVVQGNYLGFSANGQTVVSNTHYSLNLSRANSNTIGGSVAGAGNVMTGNSTMPTIYLQAQSDYNLIAGNFINLYAGGTNAVTNVIYGLSLDDSSFNQIGGPDSSYRNYLSGGLMGYALYLNGTGTQFNVIQENWLGLRPTGAVLTNSSGSLLGAHDACYNTIRSNAFGTVQNVYMVQVSTTATVGNVFKGNRFGVQEDGLTPLVVSNSLSTPFYITGGSSNVIGGTDFADGNVFAYCRGAIKIRGTNSGNAVMGNRIFSNTTSYILIDLNDNGLTANDPAPDPDIGANTLQNYPILTNAAAKPGCVRVQGYLVSTPSRSYRLEFFQSDTYFSEARWFLGYTNLTLGASGTGTFSLVLSGNAPTGRFVTATATDPLGNTSELMYPPVQVFGATDTDLDGMPDFWETQYGLNPAVSNGPSSDVDADGLYDFGEYLAATHPNNASSLLEIVDLSLASTREVAFSASPYRLYDLEVAGKSWSATTWTTVVANVIGHGAFETISDPALRTNSIYRIRCRLP